MISACSGAKMPILYSGQNSWPVGQKGIFVQILTDLFFYSFSFFFYRIFHVFLSPLNILFTSFHAKIVTLHFDQNFWLVITRGIFVQILFEFFFSFERIFHFFLGPINMLWTSFGTKMMILYSSQNTCPVGQKGIFVQILPEFFYLFIFQ